MPTKFAIGELFGGNPKAFTYIPADLPANTTDHYMHYYIGFNDGQLAYSINNASRCPPGHTHEYCVGWEVGNEYEYDADH
jgi:hypothetical protein